MWVPRAERDLISDKKRQTRSLVPHSARGTHHYVGALNYVTGTIAEIEHRPATPAAGRSARLLQGVRGRVARKNLVALIDQAVMSGANFLTVVIVGRVCGADALGIYSLAFTLLVLIASAQESLVSSPYTFYGNRVKGPRRRELAGSVLIHCSALVGLSVAGLLFTAAVMYAVQGPSPLMRVILVLAGIMPFVLLRDFARKFDFASLRIRTALCLDVAVATLQLGGLIALAQTGQLTAVRAYLVIGASCALAAAMWLLAGRSRFQVRAHRVRVDLRRNWRFGRWVFAAVITLIVHQNIVRWLLAFGLDAGSAGLFAACMAIAMISLPFIQGIHNVLLPRAARAFSSGGSREVFRVVRSTTGLIALAMTGFSLAVFFFGEIAVTWIYGADYAGQRAIITLTALIMLARALGMTAYNGLWALNHPEVNLWVNGVALITTVVAASILMPLWGIFGVTCGLLAGDVIAATARWSMFLILVRETNSTRYRPFGGQFTAK